MERLRLWAARHPWYSIGIAFLMAAPLTFLSENFATSVVIGMIVVVILNRIVTPPPVEPNPSVTSLPRAGDEHLTDIQFQDGAQADAYQSVPSPSPEDTVLPVRRVTRGQQQPSNLATMAAGMRRSPVGELVEQLEVAGEAYRTRDIRGLFGELNQEITARGTTIDNIECLLVPEPTNPHDEHAVAVLVGRWHVGYVPAEDAAQMSPMLSWASRQGVLISGEAQVWARLEGSMVRARVTIAVPCTDDVPALVQATPDA